MHSSLHISSGDWCIRSYGFQINSSIPTSFTHDGAMFSLVKIIAHFFHPLRLDLSSSIFLIELPGTPESVTRS